MPELVHEIKLGADNARRVPGGSGILSREIAHAVDVGQVNSVWPSLRKVCCLDREIRVGEILITSR